MIGENLTKLGYNTSVNVFNTSLSEIQNLCLKGSNKIGYDLDLRCLQEQGIYAINDSIRKIGFILILTPIILTLISLILNKVFYKNSDKKTQQIIDGFDSSLDNVCFIVMIVAGGLILLIS